MYWYVVFANLIVFDGVVYTLNLSSSIRNGVSLKYTKYGHFSEAQKKEGEQIKFSISAERSRPFLDITFNISSI